MRGKSDRMNTAKMDATLSVSSGFSNVHARSTKTCRCRMPNHDSDVPASGVVTEVITNANAPCAVNIPWHPLPECVPAPKVMPSELLFLRQLRKKHRSGRQKRVAHAMQIACSQITFVICAGYALHSPCLSIVLG